MKYVIKNEQEMHNLVLRLLSLLSSRSTKSATILALNGELGAGKTTFTKALAKELGITEHITSPTFVIQKSYKIPTNNSFKKLVHIDAYRLENAEDADTLNFKSTAYNPDNLIIIEWAENIKKALPKNAQHIDFTYIDEVTREVCVH